MKRSAPTRAARLSPTSGHGARFDRAQFWSRIAVVLVVSFALATVPAAGPNGPTAALVVLVGTLPAHFVARRWTGLPNPTGWLDLIAVVTATVAACIEPVVWAPSLLFQMLVLGGAVSFLPPRWTIGLGGFSIVSMTVVAVVYREPNGLAMLIVAVVFLPVLVTGSLRKQARIRRTSLRLEAVAESLPMVVWECDPDATTMTAVVGRTDVVFGRSTAALLESKVAAHVHPHDRENYLRKLASVAAEHHRGPLEMQYRYQRPDGDYAWLRDRAAKALASTGEVLRVVTIDVTEANAREIDLDRHRQIVERMPALTIVVEQGRRLDRSTVVQVTDRIKWGAPFATGDSFGVNFPTLAEHLPLQDAVNELGDGSLVNVGPWVVDDASGARRTVEVEVFPLPGNTIALLVNDVTEREAMLEQVRHQASHDYLTGLPNRSALLDAATVATANGRRCTLLLVDLNDFKSINDTLGHLTGDRYLALIAQRLAALVTDDEIISRLGGDEFGILIFDHHRGRTDELVEAVVDACRHPISLEGVPLAGSASVGVASTPSDATSAETLLRCADLAMYHAKVHNAGASRYDKSMERSTDPLRLLSQLATAFDNEEFVMYFQPKVDVGSGRTVAFEALARWHHPSLGVVEPGGFLDLIAVSGYLDRLAGIAIHQAASALAQLPSEVCVAINLTAQNLRNLSFPDMCDEAFAAAGVDLSRLIIEVTETHVFDAGAGNTAGNDAGNRSVIESLASRGVSIAVDDFGTGYSSLTHLRSMPLSELKIDSRFVRAITTDQPDLVIVQSMIDLGHNLGLQVTAEGVEDEATLRKLVSLGCDQVQGYYLGRPEPLLSAIARCLDERCLDEASSGEHEPTPSAAAHASATW
jgi:diguanylate cyclase (GGDEF)-like protein